MRHINIKVTRLNIKVTRQSIKSPTYFTWIDSRDKENFISILAYERECYARQYTPSLEYSVVCTPCIVSSSQRRGP